MGGPLAVLPLAFVMIAGPQGGEEHGRHIQPRQRGQTLDEFWIVSEIVIALFIGIEISSLASA